LYLGFGGVASLGGGDGLLAERGELLLQGLLLLEAGVGALREQNARKMTISLGVVNLYDLEHYTYLYFYILTYTYTYI